MNIKFLACALSIAGCTSGAWAATTVVQPSDFTAEATVLGFEFMDPQWLRGIFVNNLNDGEPRFAAAVAEGSFFGERVANNSLGTNYTDIAVKFDTPREMVGAWLGNVPDFMNSTVPSIDVEAFGPLSETLGVFTIVLPQEDSSPVFFGLRSDAGISRVEWRANNAGFFGMDDVMIQSFPPVPEPGSFALFGLGIAFMVFEARRRKTC